MTRRLAGNLAIVAAIVAILVISLVVGAPRGTGDEPFAGSDSQATAAVEETGHEPWFTPIFEPGSGEIESGLFALQAALGGGVLGYCIGRLHGRAKRRDDAAPDGPASPTATAGAAPDARPAATDRAR